MNKDFRILEEAYQTILEKAAKKCKWAKKGCDCDGCDDCKANQKKKLSSKQKKIAQAAPPPDQITGADFAALKKKKAKNVKESITFDELYRSVINETSKKSKYSDSPFSGPFEKSKKAWQVFKDIDGDAIDEDADYLVVKLDQTSDELLGKDVLKLDPFEIDFIQKSGVED